MTRTFLLIATLALCSCATNTPEEGRTDRAQFLKDVWAAPELKKAAIASLYDSVYIAPVHTGHLSAQTWWQMQNVRAQEGDLKRDAAHLAEYFRSSLTRAISASGIPVVNAPGPGALVMEVSITELVPSKAYWNVAATAAGFLVPGAGLASMAGSGSITVEGRLRDGGKGVVMATFADRRTDPASPVNLRSYKWYGGAEKNIDDWSRDAAAVLHAPPGKIIYRPSKITLKPW